MLSMLRRRCRPRFGRIFSLKKLCISFVILIFLIVIYVVYAIKKEQCMDEESLDMIARLCYEYRRQLVAGSLCHEMCLSRNILFDKCLNFRKGKKVMMALNEDDGTNIILKSTKGEIWDYDPIWYQYNGEKKYPPLSDFYSILLNSYSYGFDSTPQQYMSSSNVNFNADTAGEMFAKQMWTGMDFKQFIDSEPTDLNRMAAFQSLYSLVQQDEYLTLQYFQGNQHIPEIKGSCGHIYAVEYCPPGSILSKDFTVAMLKSNPWRERAEIAIGILNLIESFEDISDRHGTFHLCDVKGSNFGVGENGIVKAIDTDMAFVSKKLENELLATPNCTKHSDCDFFDCWGWCDHDENKCTKIRRNNNLQAVCSKIFQSQMGNVMSGLLKSPPAIVKGTLESLLEDCIHPISWDSAATRYQASKSTLYELRNLLKASFI